MSAIRIGHGEHLCEVVLLARFFLRLRIRVGLLCLHFSVAGRCCMGERIRQRLFLLAALAAILLFFSNLRIFRPGKHARDGLLLTALLALKRSTVLCLGTAVRTRIGKGMGKGGLLSFRLRHRALLLRLPCRFGSGRLLRLRLLRSSIHLWLGFRLGLRHWLRLWLGLGLGLRLFRKRRIPHNLELRILGNDTVRIRLAIAVPDLDGILLLLPGKTFKALRYDDAQEIHRVVLALRAQADSCQKQTRADIVRIKRERVLNPCHRKIILVLHIAADRALIKILCLCQAAADHLHQILQGLAVFLCRKGFIELCLGFRACFFSLFPVLMHGYLPVRHDVFLLPDEKSLAFSPDHTLHLYYTFSIITIIPFSYCQFILFYTIFFFLYTP